MPRVTEARGLGFDLSDRPRKDGSTPDGECVERHYASTGIAERILAALRSVIAEDEPVGPDALAPLDHFHGRGVEATKEIAAILRPQPGERVLDIGCGIGGPARWMASKFGCHVIGVDLTEEFCKAARILNGATRLSHCVQIIRADALALPFASEVFDRAYSQNVVMNIANKVGFYREALRVLRPQGLLALSNLAAGPKGEPYFPLPWARTISTSFLSTPEQTRADLNAVGLKTVSFRDITREVLPTVIAQRRRLEMQALPSLGIHILMGEGFKQLQINSARSLEDGRLVMLEVLAIKTN
jgi:sarcosine/dimethylglycine N-methyltransferase